jgi:hypothetical protein
MFDKLQFVASNDRLAYESHRQTEVANMPRLNKFVTIDDADCTPPEMAGAFCYPIEGMPFMDKLDLNLIYVFGKEMRTLGELDDPPFKAISRLLNKHEWLGKFIIETWAIPFPKTRQSARQLHRYVNELTSEAVGRLEGGDQTTAIMNDESKRKLKDLLKEFEREFEHDSREINILSVPHRCAYSTTILIERGEDLLPPDIKTAIDGYAQNEIHEAGKCLAFGLPTAAGFHLARGVESVLRRYFDVLSGGAPRPKTNSGKDIPMKGYIDRVRAWADPKIVSVLEQFTDLHRNPVSHPGEVLKEEAALTLVGISVSAVASMVNDAKDKKGMPLS